MISPLYKPLKFNIWIKKIALVKLVKLNHGKIGCFGYILLNLCTYKKVSSG